MNLQHFVAVPGFQRPDKPQPDVALRFKHSARFGADTQWLPPHRLTPSFASVDGRSVIYRRRSQVSLLGESSAGPIERASFSLGDSTQVRVDEHGYARVLRPMRSGQSIDPISNTIDGATALELDAVIAICTHLNEHVLSIAQPQLWTPSPGEMLLPAAARPFSESPPIPPDVDLNGNRLSRRITQQEIDHYFAARTRWLNRLLSWEAAQDSFGQLKVATELGETESMRQYFVLCLGDILWPLPTQLSFQVNSTTNAELEFLVPDIDSFPDREAVLANGNRVQIRPMSEVQRTQLYSQHVVGLAVRLVGELFAALPTMNTVTVSGAESAAGGLQRHIVSVRCERSAWSWLYSSGVTDTPALHSLAQLRARCQLTALGSFLTVQPFEFDPDAIY